MKLVFHNNYHNGDLHVTRAFINYIISSTLDRFEGHYYRFSQKQHLNNLKDIDNLVCTRDLHVPEEASQKLVHATEGALYINTWIGCDSGKHHKGCNLASYHAMFKHAENVLNIKFPDNHYLFTPSINFNRFRIDNAKQFIRSVEGSNLILICNGPALSTQCSNFPMAKVINHFAAKPNNHVVFTHPEPDISLNSRVTCTNDINGFMGDLNEIAYLSTFCRLIIGRSSGPHTFTYIPENIQDPYKINISICKYEEDALLCEALCRNYVFHEEHEDNVLARIINYTSS